MHRDPWTLAAALLLAAAPPLAAQADRPFASTPAAERLIDSLLAGMTLVEKLGQLNLVPVFGDSLTPAQREGVRRGEIGGFLNLTGAAAAVAAQRVAVTESRPRIPLLFGLDVIHGYRTIFPLPLAEASSWDPELVEHTARAAAREAAAAGVNWTFAPMVDIARDARWGRIAEGSGEDPFLGSVLAAARVRGFQGTDLRAPESILATAKHFAAYGAAEAGRDYNTVDVSERALREVYLPPFHAAVRAGVGSIMTSFNEIAGVPSTANHWLLGDVLRGEWGFGGFVVSDWGSIDELRAHGVAATRSDAARLALLAGVDMDMSAGIYLAEAAGLIAGQAAASAAVDEAVRRVLRAKVALGLFDDPYRGVTPERERTEILMPAARALARRAGAEAVVLLKNDGGLLPLAPTLHTIAVIGPLAADSADHLGSWSALGRAEDVVTPLAGVRERAPATTRVTYARGCGIADADTTGIAEAVAAARAADVVVLFLGEAAAMSGEAASRASLDLPGVQQRLLEAVQAAGTPVVLVLSSGRPLAVPWAADHVRALLQAWFLGVEAGHALADLLFGDVAPSGKLPVSVPRTVGQVPIHYDHRNTGRPADPDDPYTSRYLDVGTEPLFPFGFGLSYTTFRYGAMRLSTASLAPGDSLVVSASVTNTGTRAGDEVVQLYLRDEVASVTRPVRALAGFRRVSLAPGETRTVDFTLGAEQLGLYDAALRWIVEPGRFRVWVGGSSVGGLEAAFEVRAPGVAAPAGVAAAVPVLEEQVSGVTTVLQAVSAVSDSVAWVSGHQAAVLRTTDGGATWERLRVPGADSLQFRDVQAFGADDAYLLAAGPGAGSRIYRTTDGGRTWAQQFVNPEPRAFYDCFAFLDSRRGVVVSDAVDGRLLIRRTTDGGAHWDLVPPDGVPAALEEEGAFAASGTCLVTLGERLAWIASGAPAGARVYRSTDAGRHWAVTGVPVFSGEGVGPTSVAFRDARHGVALGGHIAVTTDASPQVAVTTDGGVTWSRAARPPFEGAVFGSAYVPGARPAALVAAGPGGLALSRDDGATWTGLSTNAYWAVGFASPRAGWAVGPRGRITRIRLE